MGHFVCFFFADDAVLMYDNPLGGGGVASGDRNATRLFLVLDNANHTTNNCMYMYIYIYISASLLAGDCHLKTRFVDSIRVS